MTEKTRDDVMETLREDLIEVLQQGLRPEFLNRIDEVLIFNPLTREVLPAILDIQFAHIQRLAERAGVRLTLAPGARQYLAGLGYDPVYGARPLKRVLQQRVTNRLADLLLEEAIPEGQTVRLIVQADDLAFTWGEADAAPAGPAPATTAA